MKDSGNPPKCVGDEVISTEGERESMDLQSGVFGIEGSWPSIPQLTSVQDVSVGSVATTRDADNSYSIVDICDEHDPKPITQFLPGYSSFDLNQVTTSSRECSPSNHRIENGSSLSIAGSAEFQLIDQNPELEGTGIASSRDSSMLRSKSSTKEVPISMEKDENRQVHHAPSKRVANIALKDLAKYFDVPITEASRRLEVGLTVLKRKCREFGIPRWPHRKIKSLNNLIENLQWLHQYILYLNTSRPEDKNHHKRRSRETGERRPSCSHGSKEKN
ncbi:protein RKD2 isoform X2 [Cryptomeria japonica]|uniref:protein RKD2 isoform X2 n=1 Tax=Cryptomeria japonica TaxID=3369 RepID=UPI0027DA49A7|nr:protein RKD2 isoform X2 [Cryptomeria japonica]